MYRFIPRRFPDKSTLTLPRYLLIELKTPPVQIELLPEVQDHLGKAGSTIEFE